MRSRLVRWLQAGLACIVESCGSSRKSHCTARCPAGLDPSYPGGGSGGGSGGGAGGGSGGGAGSGSGGGAGAGAGILPALVERYDYDPYGATYIAWRLPSTYDDASETRDPNHLTDPAAWQPCESSRFGNPFLWTAQRYDPAVRLYHFLFRTYSPTLGRWMQRDPAGYVDGVSLYEYCAAQPTVTIDRLGLARDDDIINSGRARECQKTKDKMQELQQKISDELTKWEYQRNFVGPPSPDSNWEYPDGKINLGHQEEMNNYFTGMQKQIDAWNRNGCDDFFPNDGQALNSPLKNPLTGVG